MGVQGNENSFFTCYLQVVLDQFFWNLEFALDDYISHYFYLIFRWLYNSILPVKIKEKHIVLECKL